MKPIYMLFALCCAIALQAQEQYLDKLPENPEPGKCYAKCIVPDEFDMDTTQVVEVLAHKILQVVIKPSSKKSKNTIDEYILSKLRTSETSVVEVGSHTDSRGSTASNQSLSERRSKSVVEYLSQKGIKTSRMIAVGYGESRLLNNCSDGVKCSESEHYKNRRTEFKFY